MSAAVETGLTQLLEEIDLQHADHKFGCIHGSVIGQDPDTGRVIVVPLCCKSWTCPACAQRLKRVWGKRVIAAQPERFLTWTVDPKLHPDPDEARVAIQKAWTAFVVHWRKGRAAKGNKHKIPPHDLEYISVWERHKSGMPHLHALIRGPYIPQSYIRRWSIRAGCGEIIDIRQIYSTKAAAAELLKYVSKAAADTSGFFEGFRLINCSRNFVPGSLAPATSETTERYDWLRSLTEAADVVATLVSRFGYTIDPKSLPGRLELIPNEHQLRLEEIHYEVDRRYDFSP